MDIQMKSPKTKGEEIRNQGSGSGFAWEMLKNLAFESPVQKQGDEDAPEDENDPKDEDS